MSYTNRIAWELLRSIDSSTLTGSYQALGGPLLFPSYIAKLVNNSTVLVTVSIDGTHDYDIAPANSFFLYDEAKYSGPALQFLPAGTQIFVKGSAGTGSIYFVSQYIVQS